MASIFGKIISKEIPAYIVAENQEFIAFLDVFPLAKGHCLVVPKQEVDNIFDIEDGQLGRMHVFSKKIANALAQAVPCRKVGVAVIGLEVPHAHIHLIPLQSVEDINFSRPKLKFAEAEMQEIQSQLQKILA